MSIPLKWAVGDRCAVRRDGAVLVGTVATIGEGCASVRLSEWRNVFVGLEELDLVSLATASTLPAPPEKEERDELEAFVELHAIKDEIEECVATIQEAHKDIVVPKPRSKRPRPAFDSALVTLRQVDDVARREFWSPRKLRQTLKQRRHTCAKVWREAIAVVFGAPARELPDLRQLSIPGAA